VDDLVAGLVLVQPPKCAPERRDGLDGAVLEELPLAPLE
jgi:hypothetical protein